MIHSTKITAAALVAAMVALAGCNTTGSGNAKSKLFYGGGGSSSPSYTASQKQEEEGKEGKVASNEVAITPGDTTPGGQPTPTVTDKGNPAPPAVGGYN